MQIPRTYFQTTYMNILFILFQEELQTFYSIASGILLSIPCIPNSSGQENLQTALVQIIHIAKTGTVRKYTVQLYEQGRSKWNN